MNNEFQTATFGGGCFWCIEAIFKELEGVISVISGYAGGNLPNPTYKQVCTGTTGHAEVVQIRFDPEKISYKNLLEIFFTIHDPTTLNRQGADVGTQYRSCIFFHNEDQKLISHTTVSELEDSGLYSNKIVTEIKPHSRFYIAEDYHQDFFANNSNQPYCRAVIDPKVTKFRKKYWDRLKKS